MWPPRTATGTNSYLPESPMRTINWDILRWSSRQRRVVAVLAAATAHGKQGGANGKRATSSQGTPPSAETTARTGSLGTSLGTSLRASLG